jgi:hypothetical protein
MDNTEGEAIDQEVFSIFILKSHPQALQQAESFLRNRKWIVGSSIKLKEALAYIIQKQPQYVFLSVDHSHKKLRILPGLLAQAFPCKVIAFAEKGGSLSLSAMTEMKLEYNLYPPVSGPAIQRLILKIRKDDEMRAKGLSADGKPLAETQEAAGSNIITFKGESQNSGEFAFDARSALSQLLASESGDVAGVIGGAQSGSMNGIAGAATQATPAPTSHDGTAAGPTNNESFSEWAERMGRQAAEQAQSGTAPAEAKKAPASTASDDLFPSSVDDDDDSPTAKNSQRQSGKGLPLMESEYFPRGKKTGYRIEEDPRYKKNGDNESIIVRGTQQAMEETVNVEGLPPHEISIATNVACILIRGTRFSGYLVCAMGENRKVDQDLVSAIQKRLMAYLKSNGEEIQEDEVLDMKIQEVDFQDWALEQADFLRKSVHNGDEIAMAFFPAGNLETKLEESASRKMLQMKLNELKDDVPVAFDLYIYMPENNKYLLYTPEGMPLYGKQKLRLQERGVTHMHLKKESAQGVKKYRAQNFLNEKVQAYKMAQKLKSSAAN